MRSKLTLPLTAASCGAVAFVLRLLQNRTGFEPDTHLPIPGNLAAMSLMVLLVAALAAMWFLSRQAPEEPLPGKVNTGMLTITMMGIGLVALAGAADLIEALGAGDLLAAMKAAADPYQEVIVYQVGMNPRAKLILAIPELAAAAGLFCAAVSYRRKSSVENYLVLMLAAPVALIVRLILTYRIVSITPSVQSYYPEILALMALTLGLYRLCTFAFAEGAPRLYSFYTAASVLLCMTALADSPRSLSAVLLFAGGAVTLLGFLLLRLFPDGARVKED